MPRRSAPPLWFLLCVAVVGGLCVRALTGEHTGASFDGGHGPQPSQAFLGFIIAIGSLIFQGLQIAAKVALTALQWSVKALWFFAGQISNGLKALGHGVLIGLRNAWEFFRLTYERVLRPFALKVWRLLQRAKQWLDATFGPVLDFLKFIRDNLLGFYNTWIRPWLDLIDVTRGLLRVLSSLGLRWARELDRRLGELEDAIERPFRYVLAKVNELVNIVNRIVTVDGLFQRLAFLRTLERDYLYAWRAATNPWIRERDDAADRAKARDDRRQFLDTVTTNTQAYMRDGGGQRAAALDEMTLIWRNYLVNR